MRKLGIVKWFRAQPGSAALSWPAVIGRAVIFSAMLALIYCRRIVWLSFSGVDGGRFDKLVSFLAYCWQDFAILTLLGLWAWFLEGKRANRFAWMLTVLMGTFVSFATVANVYALHIVGSALDASWLGEVNLRDAGTAMPMITAYISPAMKQLALVSLIGFPFVGLLLSRFAVTRLAGPVALLGCAALAALASQIGISATDLPVEKRLALGNPVFGEMRKIVVPPKSLSYLSGTGVPLKPVSHGDYAVQAERPSGFGCCVNQNIVLVTIDTVPAKAMERALSPALASRYPNLAALSESGIVLKDFYANFPMSAQSMGAMATSLYPSFSPVLTTMEEVYDRDIEILPSVLARNGYENALFMGGQLKYAGASEMLKGRGLNTIEDSDSLKCDADDAAALAIYSHLGDDCTAEAARRWIAARDKSKFFLWVWFTNPHSPYFVRARARTGGSLGSSAQHMAALAETDAALGVVRQALSDKGLLENTIFVVVGDHGEAFGEHGQLNHGTSVFEEQVRVPFLISGGNFRMRDKAVAPIGSMVDVAPSILDLAGIAAPAGWQGRSVFASDHPKTAWFASRRSGKVVGFRTGSRKFILSEQNDGVLSFDLVKDPGEKNPIRLLPDEERLVMDRVSAFVAYRKSLSWRPLRSERR